MVCLNPEILANLSSKGILAYVAVVMAGNAVATTAAMSSLVKCQSGVMLEGLKELAAVAPDIVRRDDKKWICGEGCAVQLLESPRFHDFVEDLKKYWDHLNPGTAFNFTGGDGIAVRRFLNDHTAWDRQEWQKALNYRAHSVKAFGNASRTQGFVAWVRKLGDYAGGPLNEYGRPVEGSGNVGKAIAVEHSARAAAAAFLSGATHS